ncbi:hypothetical protein [Pseudomonas lini]
MKTLNFVPLPIAGESPTSIIKRLALHNGYSNCSKFILHNVKLKKEKVSPLMQGSRIEKFLMAQIGSSLHERLQQGFYRMENQSLRTGAFIIGTIKAGRRLLRPRKAALCTECVKEGWERNIKDLCLTSHCPVHNRHYLFVCSHCQRKLTWWNQGILRCICGKAMESPACSWEEALPERRLMELIDTNDQTRFDHLMNIIKHLGIHRNKIGNTCISTYFAAAAALTFNDYQGAAEALARLIDTSDSFEIDILITKLKPVLSHEVSCSIKHLLETFPRHSPPRSRNIKIPSKCMAAVLQIGERKWREVRSSPRHRNKQTYSKAEALHILANLKTKKTTTKPNPHLSICYSHSETLSLLNLTRPECSFLRRQGFLGPLIQWHSHPYFQKKDIEHIRATYTDIKTLAERLGISKALLRIAIRNTSHISIVENLRGTPLLVKTTDIPSIEHCLHKFPEKRNSLTNCRNVQRCDLPHEQLMGVAEAANYLNVHKVTVVYYRDLGLIRCSKNDTLQFATADIKNFKMRYVTAGALGKELNIGHMRVAQLLEPLKIYPISGRIVNGNASPIYNRSTLPENLQELINPTHDTFGVYWAQKSLLSLKSAAKQLDIKHSDLIKIFSQKIRPARAKQFRGHTMISPEEINRVNVFYSSLSKLSEILSSRGITHPAFFRRFVHPGFVQIYKINDEEYLTPSDLEKITALLERYCSITEASDILQLAGGTVILLMRDEKLTPIFLSDYNYKHPLIERKEILNLKKLRSS